MTAIMHRSFAEGMGLKWAPDVAYVESGLRGRGTVTWSEVMESRRQRQRQRLDYIRRPAPARVQPCYVWVFLVPGFPFGGWWCYLVTRREQIAVERVVIMRKLTESIMRAAPCGFLPVVERFGEWMPACAAQYPRQRCKDPRPAGSVVGWLVDGKEFVRTRPTRLAGPGSDANLQIPDRGPVRGNLNRKANQAQ